MPGGPVYYESEQSAALKQKAQPPLDWTQPLQMSKKSGDGILDTKVGYKVTYVGPVTNDAYTSKGIGNMAIDLTQGDKTYYGEATIFLTKIEGDSSHVGFKLTISMPDLDPNVIVWDTKELGTPASITRNNLVKYTIVAEKLYTNNDNFNGTMDEGEHFKRDVFSDSATLDIYRIPGETIGVEETGPVRARGLLLSASASGDNLHLKIDAPVGTPLDIKLYNTLGQMVQQFGASGMTTSQAPEKLDYQLDPNLASGTYVVVVDGGQQGSGRIQIMVVK